MKYVFCLSKVFFLAVGFIILLTPQRAACEHPYITMSKELASNHMCVKSWSVLPNNDIVLALHFFNPTISSYDAYARVNSEGKFVVGPDSICSKEYSRPVGKKRLFDSSGTLYIYKDDYHMSTVSRASYNPSLGKIEEVELAKYHLSGIKGMSNLPGIGNVLFSTNRSEKPYKITIDNPETNTVQTFDFEKIKGFYIFLSRFGIHKISDTRILFIGNEGPINVSDGYYLISKFIFNLENQSIESKEMISNNELIADKAFEYQIPYYCLPFIFEKNGHIYYLASGINTDNQKTQFFLELDSNGNFVHGDKKTSLRIEESSLKDMPEDFILFYENHSPEDITKNKFWVMSLDNFPTLILDKGE